ADDPADEAATWGKEAVRAWATQSTSGPSLAPHAAPQLSHANKSPEAAWIAEGIAQCDLLRDLIPNPFHAPVLNAGWRAPRAVALARTIFQERAFAGLPELAKALEEAGCQSSELLQHCRDKKEHARGCWALDFVLGKR